MEFYSKLFTREIDPISHLTSGTTIVAMKTMKQESSAEKKDLLQELAVMKMLESHPNVVRLLGCCTEKGNFALLPSLGTKVGSPYRPEPDLVTKIPA